MAMDSNDDIGLEKRLELYRLQIEIRDCEKRAYDLFLQNLIKGTSHLSLGQEAIAAGFAVAMQNGPPRRDRINGPPACPGRMVQVFAKRADDADGVSRRPE